MRAVETAGVVYQDDMRLDRRPKNAQFRLSGFRFFPSPWHRHCNARRAKTGRGAGAFALARAVRGHCRHGAASHWSRTGTVLRPDDRQFCNSRRGGSASVASDVGQWCHPRGSRFPRIPAGCGDEGKPSIPCVLSGRGASPEQPFTTQRTLSGNLRIASIVGSSPQFDRRCFNHVFTELPSLRLSWRFRRGARQHHHPCQVQAGEDHQSADHTVHAGQHRSGDIQANAEHCGYHLGCQQRTCLGCRS